MSDTTVASPPLAMMMENNTLSLSQKDVFSVQGPVLPRAPEFSSVARALVFSRSVPVDDTTNDISSASSSSSSSVSSSSSSDVDRSTALRAFSKNNSGHEKSSRHRYKKYRYVVYEEIIRNFPNSIIDNGTNENRMDIRTMTSKFLVAHLQPESLRNRVWNALFETSNSSTIDDATTTTTTTIVSELHKPKFWDVLLRYAFVNARIYRRDTSVEFASSSCCNNILSSLSSLPHVSNHATTTTTPVLRVKMPLFVEFGEYVYEKWRIQPENWFALFTLQFLRGRNLVAVAHSREWCRRLALRSVEARDSLLHCLQSVMYTSERELARELVLLHQNMTVALRPLPPLAPPQTATTTTLNPSNDFSV